MWKTTLKLAVRSLAKDKLSSVISIIGLSAGLGVSCFVLLLLWNQVTHDTFHPASDRLYRVTSQLQTSDATDAFATSPGELAPRLASEVSAVETATRLRRGPGTLTSGSSDGSSVGIGVETYYAEPTFFDAFGFRVQAGTAERLSEPNTVILTADAASRLFGRPDVVGESVVVPDRGTFQVVATMDPAGRRSHLNFDALLSLSSISFAGNDEIPRRWAATADRFYTYLRLAPSTRPSTVETAMEDMRRERAGASSAGTPFEIQGLSLQPLGQIMIGATLQNENARGALPASVAILLVLLAATVLLGAAFNYVNLSVARGLTRGREVGVRKTMGASRTRIMTPFLVESVLIALAALAVGLALLVVLVPAFNRLWAVQQIGLAIDLQAGGAVYAAFVGLAVVVGVAAGIYPAWRLSGFEATEVLRSRPPQSESSLLSWITTRKTLVVTQFVVSVVVAISAVVLFQQTRHMQTADYGFRSDRLLQVQVQGADPGLLKQRAEALASVESVSQINTLPMSHALREISVDAPTIPEVRTDVLYYTVDVDLFDQFGFPLLAGSIDPRRFETGRTGVINASAVASFGFENPQAAIGQSIKVKTDTLRTVEITGVVPDFTYSFFDSSRRPILFRYDPTEFAAILARYAPGQKEKARQEIKAAFASLDGANPYEAESVGALVGRIVNPLVDLGWILGLIAAFAAAIGILGLLGMATFSVQSRMREIGIRKALGASIPTLIYRLASEYVGLVGTGILIGLPVAWWLNAQWLQRLEVHVDVGLAALFGTGLLLAVLAVAAIFPKTLRAALTPPVRVLRDE